jgi:uncharacterized membrane protein
MDFSPYHYSGRVLIERSFLKAITWRIVGTVSLWITVYLFTGRISLAIGISLVDIISNIVLYYCHERIWDWSDWGRRFIDGRFISESKRMIAKAASWKILASIYLFLVVNFLSEQSLIVSSGIVFADAFLNIIEYYFHEYAWNRVKWGRIKKFEEDNQ